MKTGKKTETGETITTYRGKGWFVHKISRLHTYVYNTGSQLWFVHHNYDTGVVTIMDKTDKYKVSHTIKVSQYGDKDTCLLAAQKLLGL